jgi:hypothetical protein
MLFPFLPVQKPSRQNRHPEAKFRFAAVPLVVFFGGFGSCFLDGHPAEIPSSEAIHGFIAKLSDEVGEPVPAIEACYAIGNYPVYSSRYDHVTDSHFDEGESDLETLFDWIESEAEGRPLILAGQSHGGWTAMKAVLHMKRNVDVLNTADPISVVNCHAAAFSASTIGHTILGFKPWDGCTKAPEDLRPDYKEIAAKTGRWNNFYQTETKFLHSSKIHAADFNQRLTFDGWSMNPFRGHAWTEGDARVWDKLLESAKASLAL